jgi:two-component system, LytTR family, response regulator
MIRTVLIDDERNNISNLQKLLTVYCPAVTVVGTATSVLQGLQTIKATKPDLLLLDIQLAGESGFDLLQQTTENKFEVIFVTAFSEYGIRAIKFAALDYLLKPVNPQELQQAIAKAAEKMQQQQAHQQLQSLLQYVQQNQNKEMHRIALPSAKETRLVSPNHIIRCESNNNYTKFILQSGEAMVISKPIYEYEELLKDYGFIRCHQTHLVNLSAVKSWLKIDNGCLQLHNGEKIPVSRQKKEIVKAALLK